MLIGFYVPGIEIYHSRQFGNKQKKITFAA